MKSAHQRIATPGRAPVPWILVVDDDAAIREVIQLALEDDGYQVTTASNGEEALACLAACNSGGRALVLLDLNMPVMTGWECYERLERLPCAPPVVFMTAGPVARHEAMRHHAAGFLAKPFNLDDLETVVKRPLSSG